MKITSTLLFPICLALASINASATVVPTYDQFGTLDAADFGGANGRNTAVAIDTFMGKNVFTNRNTGTITLGLTVLPGSSGMPAVRNDGHGTFTVTPGVDSSTLVSFLDQWAKWDLGWHIDGGSALNFYSYNLLIDVDPSAKENFKTLSMSMNSEGTLNLGEFKNELLGGYTFNPSAIGSYSMILQAVQFGSDVVVGKTSIVVNVAATAVPEPGSLALLAGAFAGLITLRRRRA